MIIEIVKAPKSEWRVGGREEVEPGASTLQEQVPVSGAQLQRPCSGSQVSASVPLRSQSQATQSGKSLYPREH